LQRAGPRPGRNHRQPEAAYRRREAAIIEATMALERREADLQRRIAAHETLVGVASY
jgi:hypothetical protein